MAETGGGLGGASGGGGEEGCRHRREAEYGDLRLCHTLEFDADAVQRIGVQMEETCVRLHAMEVVCALLVMRTECLADDNACLDAVVTDKSVEDFGSHGAQDVTCTLAMDGAMRGDDADVDKGL